MKETTNQATLASNLLGEGAQILSSSVRPATFNHVNIVYTLPPMRTMQFNDQSCQKTDNDIHQMLFEDIVDIAMTPEALLYLRVMRCISPNWLLR